MKTAYSICAGLVVAFSLTGCVPDSVHPLADPEAASPDPRLAGLWTATIEDETAFVHFLPKDGPAVEIVSVNYRDTGSGSWLAFSAFTNRIDEDWYMNVKFLAESGEAFDENEQNYILCRYEITGDDQLTLWMMAEEALVEDIGAGRVEGVVEEGQWVNTIRLTAGRDALNEYIRSSDRQRLFGNHLGTFRRVR